MCYFIKKLVEFLAISKNNKYMKYNKKLERFVNKEQYSNFKADYKALKRLHNSLFSKKRMYVYKIIRTIIVILFFLAPVLVMGLLFFFAPIITNQLEKTIDKIIFDNMANWCFTFAITASGTVVLQYIFLSYKSDYEYFDKNELRLFLGIQIFRSQPMLVVIIQDALSTIMLIAAKIVGSNSSIIIASIYVFIYSISITIIFIRVKKANQIERYFIYARDKGIFYKPTLDNAIKENIWFSKQIKKHEADEFIKNYLSAEGYSLIGFDKIMKKLEEKANQGSNIVVEQNIIEKHIDKYCRKAKSLYQEMSIYIMVKTYIDILVNVDKNKKKTNTEELKTFSNFVDHLLYNKLREIISYSFQEKDYGLIFVYKTELIKFINDQHDIVVLQTLSLTVLKLLCQEMNVFKNKTNGQILTNLEKRIHEFEKLPEISQNTLEEMAKKMGNKVNSLLAEKESEQT